jgi:hypothetical protein
MKLMSLFLFFMAINIGLLLVNYGAEASRLGGSTGYYPSSTLVTSDPANPDFGDSVPPGSNAITSTDNLGVDGTKSASAQDIWNVFLFPGAGNSSRILIYLGAFALLIGALGFIPFINRSDLSVLSGPFIIILAIGAPTAINTYNFVNNQVSGMACLVGETCFIANILGAMVGGTLMIAWIFASLEWWTGRPTS